MFETGRRIALRRWSAADRGVLDRTVGDSRMMRYLGGPEDARALDARHARYVTFAQAGPACMYVIELGDEATPVGSAGFWESAWCDEAVIEMGWMVLDEFAGRGIASAAAAEMLERARELRELRYAHAFPARTNAASNAVCRKAGFVLVGPCEVEYPAGHVMKSNDWRYDLRIASLL